MFLDLFNLLVSIFLFAIYSSIFVISIIFTFFLDTYCKIDAKLKLEVISAHDLTPLEQNIDWIDAWLMSHNKIVGPILTLLCLLDIKYSFDLFRILNML